MSFQHDADPAELYDRLRLSFAGFLDGLSSDELMTAVPATPAWTVVDVLAHVVGITADLNHGRFGQGMSPDEWTAAQVETRRGRSVAALAAEWEAEAPTFVAGLGQLGYAFGAHYLGDLLQHVADVRQALHLPPPPDDETLVAATDFYLESFDRAARAADCGTVIVAVGDERFTAGVGDVVAEVHAPRYEMFRALGGRRSTGQIRRLEWSGDVVRVLPSFSQYPPPVHDIIEPPTG